MDATQGGLNAAVLQARLQSHTNALILRLENVLATLIPPSAITDPITGETIPAQTSHTQTATEAFQLSVETAVLIRACEQLMGLSRAMKEIWLSGGLDTLEEDGKDGNGSGGREVGAMKEDQEVVLGALLKELTGKDVGDAASGAKDDVTSQAVEVDMGDG